MKKTFIQHNVLPIAFAAVATLLSAGCSEEKSGQTAQPPKAAAPAAPAPMVNVGKASETDYNPIRHYNGRILSTEAVAIVPQVSGQIVEVAFKEGDIVKKGDLLYRIDDVRYAAAVASAKATVAQAKATADYAEKTFERTKTLLEKKVASNDEMDAATSELTTSKAALEAAEAALISAKDNLEHCRITAPITGKIGVNAFTAGNYVTPATPPLTTIVQQDPLRVSFPTSNRDFLRFFGSEEKLRSNFTINIRLANNAAYGHEGKVEFLGNKANASTDTLTVFASIPNPDGVLLPGATVAVELQAKKVASSVVVPLPAVLHDKKGSYVWVVDGNNVASRRDIIAGGTTEAYQVVLSGLKANELIVTSGTHKVVPGKAIAPVFDPAA